MDAEMREKERAIERLALDEEVESKKKTIAELQALKREAKRKYGSNWKQILGIIGSLKPNMDSVHTLYTADPSLRELSKPGSLSNLRR